MNKLAGLPFGERRVTEILREVERWVPEKLEEIGRDFSIGNVFHSEAKAFFWIAQAREKSPSKAMELFVLLYEGFLQQARGMALVGYAIEELKKRDISALGCGNVEEIVSHLFGSCDNTVLESCIKVYREISDGADVETLWRLITQNHEHTE